MADLVTIRHLSKKFGAHVTALEDVTLDIAANAFVSIVGPSGCGKSTLLRLISGLIPATSGQITVAGETVRGPIRQSSMVFQSPVLLPWRTVLENVFFVAELGHKKPSTLRGRALELLEMAGLGGFEDHYPHQLSGGMQQRASICRALLMNPPLILMDEPFGALDVLTREILGFKLQEMWGANRNTVLFITHSISEAILLSDTVVVMTPRPGKISEIIPIDLPRPRTIDTLSEPRFIELAARIRSHIGTQWEG
ncbi:ABC transporter ATP-binding protein [Castellaniella sp.]|uniref:ABC transporter ATP-binding protein n=1 Tax=Castellaniella sp. TaxID=1955812 RepID=UPI00356926E7